jgi:hypothetical protein
MIEIALRRGVSKVVANARVAEWQRESRGRPTVDGKGKGRPSGRPMWLVVREDLVTTAMATAGALRSFSKEIKAASAIARKHKAVLRHDKARR